MTVYVLSRSASYDRHVLAALGAETRPELVRVPGGLPQPAPDGERPVERRIVLVHAESFQPDLFAVLDALGARGDLVVGLGQDRPRLESMLACTGHGVQAYFNSYMADLHYRQMIAQLAAGQSWLLPELLEHALDMARSSLRFRGGDDPLAPLTPRERDIALDVARGMSNREIASASGITERTVKTHLTRVFRKLGLKSRHALAVELRGEPDRSASAR